MENYILPVLSISAGAERLTEYSKSALNYNLKHFTIAINVLLCVVLSFLSSVLILSTWPISNTTLNYYVVILVTGLLASSGSSYINPALELIKTVKGIK